MNSYTNASKQLYIITLNSICRKTLFDDSNIDLDHEFTPKKNYSYKRYKKSFVNTNECTSYFLNHFDNINMNDEKGGKISCPNAHVI